LVGLIYKTQSIVNSPMANFLWLVRSSAHDLSNMAWPFPGLACRAVLAAQCWARQLNASSSATTDHPHATLAMATVGYPLPFVCGAPPLGSDIYTFPPIVSGPLVANRTDFISPQSILTVCVALALTAMVFLLAPGDPAGPRIKATQQNSSAQKWSE